MNRTGLLFLIGFLSCPAAAAEPRAEVQADWAWQHRIMVVQDGRSKVSRLRHADAREQPAPLTDPQAGIVKDDRDPTDLAARRTAALLRHLAQAHPALPGWAEFRRRLDPLLAAAEAGAPDLTGQDPARQRTYTALCALRREIALSNPLLDFEDILFSVEANVGQVLQRATTGQYNCIGRGHDRNTEPGGGLYILRGWKGDAPQVVALCQDARVENGPYQGQTLSGGVFHAPSLSYDGKTVLFSWAKLHYEAWPNSDREAIEGPPAGSRTADPMRLFRINVDGTHLRQIATDEGGHNDTEPIELPDGRVLFMSTRREVYDRCIAYRPAFTLCSMKPDGTDILALSFHETHEWLPSVANDGKVLYTRWDYVDRSVHSAHGIWTCFPDGRDPRAPSGNYMWDNVFRPDTPYARFNPPAAGKPKRQPCAVSHCRAIPGSGKIMAIGGWHHTVEVGPVMVLDLGRPDDYAGGQVFAMTPGPWGGDRGGEFSAPWPLSEDFFLVNCLDRIYLMDRFGNREFIVRSELAHQRNRWFQFWLRYFRFNKAGVPVPDSIPADLDDPWLADYHGVAWRPTFPRPVKARPRPPVVPTLTFQSEDRRGAPGRKPATITVQNVYDTDIPLPEGVKVKALRLVQVLGASSGNYTGVNGRNTSAVKIVLGTTPVEEDGSVHCLAPIEKGVYFQLLDQDGLAVQSMLSVTYVHPGERLSCQGCHEKTSGSPPVLPKVPAAMRRAPTTITPETPDGKVAISESYLVPAVDRVLAACARLPGGPPTTDRRELVKAGWLRYSEGFGVNQGDKSFRTTPDAFGARGCKLWEFIQANKGRLGGLQKDDIRLTALYMDLLCVGSSTYQNNVVTGPDGRTWPRHPDLDVNNPLGLEVVPSAPGKTAWAAKRGD
jgi:hypothetical protein